MQNTAPQLRRGSATPHVPIVLGFDTATADAVVAVAAGDDVLSERRAASGDGGRPRHAEVLMAEVEAAVREAGDWERIDRIAVGVGPGTFTGLRIGIATARALAQARGLPVTPVGSLEALARGIGERAPGRARLPLIDARRGEVFAALFDPSGAQLLAPVAAEPTALASTVAELSTSPVAAGDGSLRFRQQLESAGVEVLPEADPAQRMAGRHVCALAAAIEPRPVTEVHPAYLRRPDAEVWREQRDRDTGPG